MCVSVVFVEGRLPVANHYIVDIIMCDPHLRNVYKSLRESSDKLQILEILIQILLTLLWSLIKVVIVRFLIN